MMISNQVKNQGVRKKIKLLDSSLCEVSGEYRQGVVKLFLSFSVIPQNPILFCSALSNRSLSQWPMSMARASLEVPCRMQSML